MRTMDQGQLQKILTAAAANSQNPLMLFSPMTSSPTTTTAISPPTPSHQMSWPLKTTFPLDANLAALMMLQQTFNAHNNNNQPASLPPTPVTAPVISTPSMLPTFPFFPTVSTVSTPTPQCATPPHISTILLQMQKQNQKSSTPPAQNAALRKVSTVSLPAEFVTLTAGSTGGSLPASSPSTSSKKEEEDDEEEEEEFVDIESVDVAIDGKEKRKAHVEFYRRMKYMRQHFREKFLSCFECKKKIDNQENAIAVHVAEHADAGGYQCRLCGWQSIDKYKIYQHMRLEHPRKVDMFVDKRDMPKMCVTLSQCFPKTTCRPKKESNRNADTYLSMVIKNGSSGEKVCEVCKASVRRDKAAMIRHVQTNHTIKCKTCKKISESLEEQRLHQETSHQLKEPKMSVHYAPSAAAIYLLPALEKCFPAERN